MSFGVTGIYIIITKPTHSTESQQCNHSISKVLVVIHVYNRHVGRK